MKCNTCVNKVLYIGGGPPDDYSCTYCRKDHWENGNPEDLDEDNRLWDNCPDYEPLKEAEPEKVVGKIQKQ